MPPGSLPRACDMERASLAPAERGTIPIEDPEQIHLVAESVSVR
jgi:hypothetical protein